MENKITKYEEILDKEYGQLGTTSREEYEMRSLAFRVGELVKEERKKSHMTQKQLAEKAGTKRTYISRIENGRSDIQLNTLHKIIETGLGRTMSLTIK
jgi:HTH-type transcriptional regulator / antitoxin HipB